MDEKKRKELESLRSQIDPEILRRVAESMAGDTPANTPPSTAKPHSTGRKLPPPPPDKKAIRERQMSELQMRIRRREMEVDAQRTVVKKVELSIVVYDENIFRSKQIGGYFTRMGYTHLAVCNDMQTVIKSVIERLNDPDVIRTVYAVSEDIYDSFKTQIYSDEFLPIRQKVPAFAKLPTFIMLPPDKPPITPKGRDAAFVIAMAHNASFSAKKIRTTLHIE